MIEYPTVLVLGAGASMPYGFPSGSGLRRIILDGLSDWAGGRTKARHAQFGRTMSDAGWTEEDVGKFRTELLQADTTSIDEFLGRREEFSDIGKCAIATALIPLEAPDALFLHWRGDFGLELRPDQVWYHYFASTLRFGFNSWPSEGLTILTYNYDRSLDHYLFTILRSSCAHSGDECWKKFRQLPIIHLHGELGTYEPLKEGSLPYGSGLNGQIVRTAAKEIKIVHEIAPGGRFDEAQAAIDQADVVCFLGFGYAQENMNRLDFRRGKPKKTLGSAYNLTEWERRRLNLGSYVDEVFLADWDVLRILRDSQVLGSL